MRLKRDLAGNNCESIHGESSVVRVEEVADRVEDVENCRLLWQRAGRQHRCTYWRRSLMWHGSRASLTAVEIPPSDYGHRQKRTPTMPAKCIAVCWQLLPEILRVTCQLASRVDGQYGGRTATVSTRLVVDRRAVKLKTSGWMLHRVP